VGASCRRRVTRGIFVHEFDIRGEASPGEDSLEQVVAQQRVLWHTPRQCRLERIDFEDALADVRSLTTQVLVHV
jgi:hypothetical protein